MVKRSKWSDETTEKFLTLYRTKRVLWDKTYKKRDKEELKKAWNDISKEMGCQVDELKNRKEALRSKYRAYISLTKKMMSKKLEGPPEPTWFGFKILHEFLAPSYPINIQPKSPTAGRIHLPCGSSETVEIDLTRNSSSRASSAYPRTPSRNSSSRASSPDPRSWSRNSSSRASSPYPRTPSGNSPSRASSPYLRTPPRNSPSRVSSPYLRTPSRNSPSRASSPDPRSWSRNSSSRESSAYPRISPTLASSELRTSSRHSTPRSPSPERRSSSRNSLRNSTSREPPPKQRTLRNSTTGASSHESLVVPNRLPSPLESRTLPTTLPESRVLQSYLPIYVPSLDRRFSSQNAPTSDFNIPTQRIATAASPAVSVAETVLNDKVMARLEREAKKQINREGGAKIAQNEADDVCGLFGRLLATQLRQLPENIRNTLFVELLRMIHEKMPNGTTISNSATNA